MLLLPVGHFRAPLVPLLLDTLAATVRGAWEVRKLRSAYAGPCMKVRRTSDNLEADIGFTAAGDLDTGALLAFCGSASGFVSKLYDQSAAAQHLVQTVASSQQRIVLSGVVDRLATGASRPAMVGNHGSTYMVNPSFSLGGSTYAAFGVCALFPGHGQYSRTLIFKGAGDDRDYNGPNSVVFATFGGNVLSAQKNGGNFAPVSIGTAPFAYGSVWDAGTVTFGVDAASGAAGTSTSVGATGLLVWGSSDVGVSDNEVWEGQIAAHIVTSGTLSVADNAAIRASQKSYYGTP